MLEMWALTSENGAKTFIVLFSKCAFCFLMELFICLCKVVELDFLYPSEGIHRRWESGYRITSMAATADQAAFILSIPKRKVMDETQETLRTSAFPSTHVKVRSILQLFLIASNLMIY